jgi:5-methylcytosine-specific restriction protein A
MAASDSQRAKVLATRWGLDVRHALYRKTGNWYHKLKTFPGALLDADGYVIFDSEQTFGACPQLQIGKQVSAPRGIKAIPGYVYVSAGDDQPDRALVESFVRTRSPASGQGWGTSPEARKAIETYAMGLAVRHYSAAWPEVVDVSANQPFDLLCRDGDRELRVEVKGTTSRGLSVLLTRNEVRHAQANAERVALFVVSEIKSSNLGSCTGGVTRVIEPWDIRCSELDPIAFECWPEARHNKRLQPTARVSSSDSSTERARRG